MKNTKSPTTWKYFETLIDLGLGSDGAKIYEFLLKNNGEKASIIAKGIGLSRVLTYRGLGKLVDMGIVEKVDEEGSVTTFFARHPSYLTSLLERSKQRISKAELELARDVGLMASDHNLASGKPNVQFFEGSEAIKKITGDYPEQDTEIRQWIDIGLASEIIHKETATYVHTRVKRGISKRMIVPRNEKNMEYTSHAYPLTEFRTLESSDALPTSIQIYDDRVTILTLSTTSSIGMIIEDTAIANVMKIIFDQQWQNLGPQKNQGNE